MCFPSASVSRLRVNWPVAAGRALAVTLAGALLLLALLAANGSFHQALHHGKAASGNCVLCLFIKGHVDSPQSASLCRVSARCSLDPAPRMNFVAAVDFRYLVSPSRAPPLLGPLLSVVA
ncbi:exported hypothetical protein [Verrucomicrobia bacterium]|nr:exported hypothetical protein [Verrucomicrobiota bacterium]